MNEANKINEHEAKAAALRHALIEGEESGFIEDFDFSAYLAELKARAEPK